MMKKVLAIAGMATALLINGCLLDGGTEEDNGISFKDVLVTDTVRVGSGASGGVPIEGIMEANAEITNIQFTVYNSSQANVTSSFSFLTFVTPIGKSKVNLKDQNATITATSTSLTSGTYNLKISGEVNGEITSIEKSFQVKNGNVVVTPDLKDTTVTVAGHGSNTIGSSFDLDAGKVMLATDAIKANSGVDLVYTFSATRNSPVLMTPVYAKNSSNIAVFENWVSPNATQFHEVFLVDFDAITTKAEIQALFNASLASSTGRENCAANSVFVVKTDTGAYALLRMETVSTSSTGTATIKFAR